MRTAWQTGKLGLAQLCIILSVVVSSHAQAPRQFILVEDFEKGALPPDIRLVYQANTTNIRVHNLEETPPGPVGPKDRDVCSRYGLRLALQEADKMAAVVWNHKADRTQSAADDLVIFQVDVYFPQDTQTLSGTALMAATPPDPTTGKTAWEYYRFGVLNGKVCFSLTGPEEQQILNQEDSVLLSKVTLPGWHRLQMVFEGREKIHCTLDGYPTRFSPLADQKLGVLYPGVMASLNGSQASARYVDNLCVVKNSGGTKPDPSPWSAPGVAVSATPAQPNQITPVPSPVLAPTSLSMPTGLSPQVTPVPTPIFTPAGLQGNAAVVNWSPSIEEALKLAQAQQKPIAVLFCSKQSPSSARFDTMLQSDTAARQLLARCITVKHDISTPQGSSIANTLRVYRTPCLVVYGSDGKERSRAVFNTPDAWPSVVEALRSATNH